MYICLLICTMENALRLLRADTRDVIYVKMQVEEEKIEQNLSNTTVLETEQEKDADEKTQLDPQVSERCWKHEDVVPDADGTGRTGTVCPDPQPCGICQVTKTLFIMNR